MFRQRPGNVNAHLRLYPQHYGRIRENVQGTMPLPLIVLEYSISSKPSC